MRLLVNPRGLALTLLLPACGGNTPFVPPAPNLPLIQSLLVTGVPAAPGGTVEISALAQSSEGLTLTYAWDVQPVAWVIAAGGDAATVTLTAPDGYGLNGIATLTVTDSEGSASMAQVAIGTERNLAPTIHSLTAGPNPVPRDTALGLAISATDATGGTLSYTWTLPAGFTLVSGQGTAQLVAQTETFSSGMATVVVTDEEASSSSAAIYIGAASGAWQTPVPVEPGPDSQEPRVATSGRELAFAVWSQFDGLRQSLWVNGFAAGVWQTPALLELSDAGDALAPQVAVDDLGRGVAVWLQHDGVYSLWTATRAQQSGVWESEALESDDTGNAGEADLALIPGGGALVVWPQDDGSGTDSLWWNAMEWVPPSLVVPFETAYWTGPELLETPLVSVSNPQIAMNDAGEAIAVWVQDDGDLMARRWALGVWQGPEVVAADVQYASGHQVAIDAAGNAVVVWLQTNGLQYDLWASHSTESGWSSPELLHEGNPDGSDAAEAVQVVLDGAGNGFAVWHVPSLDGRVLARRFASGAWSAVQRLGSGRYESGLTAPRIAMDDAGNAIVVSSSGVSGIGARSVWARRHSGGAWQTPVWLELDADESYAPDVAVDNFGNAIAVWVQADPYRVWASSFH